MTEEQFKSILVLGTAELIGWVIFRTWHRDMYVDGRRYGDDRPLKTRARWYLISLFFGGAWPVFLSAWAGRWLYRCSVGRLFGVWREDVAAFRKLLEAAELRPKKIKRGEHEAVRGALSEPVGAGGELAVVDEKQGALSEP